MTLGGMGNLNTNCFCNKKQQNKKPNTYHHKNEKTAQYLYANLS